MDLRLVVKQWLSNLESSILAKACICHILNDGECLEHGYGYGVTKSELLLW
jgi:hypothetical protein